MHHRRTLTLLAIMFAVAGTGATIIGLLFGIVPIIFAGLISLGMSILTTIATRNRRWEAEADDLLEIGRHCKQTPQGVDRDESN